MATQPADGNVLLDVAGAADYLGVSEAFVRRLVLERRVRYYKVGKLVRFRPVDLDAFVEAGRRDPVEPWVPARSPLGRSSARTRVHEAGMPGKRPSATTQHGGATRR